MTDAPHDFESQRRETFAVFAGIQSSADLPDEGDVEFAFVPVAGADWDGLEKALSEADYETGRFIDDKTPPEYDPYLLATLPDHLLSAQAIWVAEEHATRLALAHGFRPDGWGFMS